MPILDATRIPVGRSLTLQLDDGLNDKGEVKIVNKSFSNIREEATDADILNSAHILEQLQDKPLEEVVVTEKHTLIG